MKKLFFAVLFSGVFFAASAQSKDTLDVVVAQFCECVTQKKDSLPDNGKKIDLMDELQGCILSAIANNIDVLKAKYGKDFVLNEANGEKVGKDIGMRAVLDCPAFMLMVTKSQQFQDEIDGVGEEKEEQTFTKTVKLKRVDESSDFVLVVKEDGGKEERLQIIRNGLGVSDFLSNYKNYVGKNITVTYAITEIYNAARKEFELKKELISIDLE